MATFEYMALIYCLKYKIECIYRYDNVSACSCLFMPCNVRAICTSQMRDIRVNHCNATPSVYLYQYYVCLKLHCHIGTQMVI